MPRKYRFRTRLFKGGDAVNSSTFAAMEFDSVGEFKTKGRVAVKGKINGTKFQGMLMPYGGKHLLTVNKTIQAAAHVEAGSEVLMEIERDTEVRLVEVPPDVEQALKASKAASDLWKTLAPSHQKVYVTYIEQAKKAETRERRIKKMMEMLSNGRRSPKA